MRGWRPVAVSGAVFGVNAIFLIAGPSGGSLAAWPWGWLLQLVSAGALAWKDRHPRTALAVTGSAALLYYPLGFPDAPLAAGFVIALYTVARDGRRWLAIGDVLVLLAGFPLMALLVHGRDRAFELDTAIGQAAILVATVTAGEISRARRERAEALARDRAAQERLRIARELHDVMAHQISLISVQAGAALHRRDPETAFEALEHIRVASKEALREFRTVLGMLRTESESMPRTESEGMPRTESERMPPAGSASDASLARLPDLLAGVRATGVSVRLTGEPPAGLPAEVDAAAFRIVQESLSNVLRHAGATAVEIVIDDTKERLTLRIDDDGAGSPGAPGNGITGMRERAAALGGQVEAGCGADGGFSVRVELPK
ncbi:two-component sensor histidine kinase [Actinoplanes ianthinogenes]|uniref:histidine kinase n=1 Tax=Actinoplanes ianthinogenes TaxID=122358 RepID=A0ABM7M5S4_9ACTN|nr:sensor histidine kinase [Actinoplanes ianthinogenes]BCJ46948.1 two-component sensor histidine kinase [Actinoplanes ianthinogenes]GGR14436.1 two-component sensor histidine kinase [Actinoplanes ianthinogenes]